MWRSPQRVSSNGTFGILVRIVRKTCRMNEDDLSYYQHRAEFEVVLALEARAPEAAKRHFQLTAAYLDKIALPNPVGIDLRLMPDS